MPTQTVQFRALPGLTLTVSLFNQFNDEIIETKPAAESSTRKGTYIVSYTDLEAGYYEITASVGNATFASYEVRIEDETNTFSAYDPIDPVVQNSIEEINTQIGNINNPISGFMYSDKATNANTNDPIQGALIEVFAAGTTNPLVTSTTSDAIGDYTVFSSSDGPFDIRVSSSGFETVTVTNVTFVANN